MSPEQPTPTPAARTRLTAEEMAAYVQMVVSEHAEKVSVALRTAYERTNQEVPRPKSHQLPLEYYFFEISHEAGALMVSPVGRKLLVTGLLLAGKLNSDQYDRYITL